MGFFVVRAISRKNIIAIVAGVLLAGAPLIAFNLWLHGLIDRQGQEDVESSAKRAVTLAESRFNQVISALDGLAARGVNGCSPEDVEAIRRAAFETMPIKEIAVVGPGGQTLCTDLGLPLGKRKVIWSEPLADTSWYSIAHIRLDDGQSLIRLSREVAGGPIRIAALIPVSLFLPQFAAQGGPFSAFGQIATSTGALIGNVGERAGAASQTFMASMKSDKYGFTTEISMSRERVNSGSSDLQWLGLFATGAVIIILGVFSIMMPKRRPGDPVAELERALAAGEFVPYYQPIVDIRSGQLRGAEVLVRWRKPDGSLVYPGSFIPLAESSGMIRAMTRDLMKRVCIEVGAALSVRPALKISFNFAGQLFSDESIVKDVRNIFSGSPIKLSQVVLEVTERDPIENFTATRQTIAALQELGVRIAIDDVGTGHSGLSYMLKLGVDIIKIDKMFVDAIGTDRNSTTIVETLVDLAHNMRMDVVAEGVENFEQVMYLRELGVRSAQGYVFAPPLPGKSFLQLIEATDPLAAAHAEPAMAIAEVGAQVSAA
jgi:sensor c-di-GMP phosphodiesterase-like protein